jgi:shikimate dehydrogenase
MAKKDRYAVFGSPIKHSKSPRIHQLFAEQTKQQLEYTAKEVPAENFKTTTTEFFSRGGKGLNCTLPLKELAWALANNSTERAELSKAVNTLVLQPNGQILGDNTDGCGLVTDLTANNDINLKDARILLLGAGGASRGILGPLLEHSPSYLFLANRTRKKAVDLAAEFSVYGEVEGCGYAELKGKQFDLIINATSASLYDDMPPLETGILRENGVCYDLAYGNRPTAFVRWGVMQNAGLCLDGLGMLVEQAAEAFYIWRKVRPTTKPVIEALNAARKFTMSNSQGE